MAIFDNKTNIFPSFGFIDYVESPLQIWNLQPSHAWNVWVGVTHGLGDPRLRKL